MNLDFESERQLHEIIESSIGEEKFADIIDSNIFQSEKNNSIVIPRFSLDYITRKKLLEAGLNVLESLHTLHILTSDDNISVTKNEGLRPDIVAICNENESIVLFEFKKSKQTERQTLTELLAYEQEIKNILPMLSNYDFKFVIITTEWSPLLQHSVASKVAWSNRQILCLTASLNSDNNLILETFIPTAWRNTGNVFIPESAMPCITLCLYDKENRHESDNNEGQFEDDDSLYSKIITAVENIVHTGNLMNTHGFVLLWEDSYYGKLSSTKYNITICGISAYDLYNESLLLNDHTAKHWLIKAVSAYINEFSPTGHSESLLKIAESSNSLLESFVNPTIEGFSTWEHEKNLLSYRADVLYCDFFGLIGEYVRDYTLNPEVKKSNVNRFLDTYPDWKHPTNGLRFINNLSKPHIFGGGQVMCSDAFKLGRLIGIDIFLRENLRIAKSSVLMNRFQWNLVLLLEAFDEITLITETADNMEVSIPTHFYFNPEEYVDYAERIDWLLKSFFSDSNQHALFFFIGLNGNILFDKLAKESFSQDELNTIFEEIQDNVISAINLVLEHYRQLESEDGFYNDLENTFKELKQVLGLTDSQYIVSDDINCSNLDNIWQVVLHASDKILFNAFHTHKNLDLSKFNIDWDYLKQGVKEMHERGENDAGVVISANGEYGTGRVFYHLGVNPEAPPEDNKVWFMNNNSGFPVAVKATWEEIISGKVLK